MSGRGKRRRLRERTYSGGLGGNVATFTGQWGGIKVERANTKEEDDRYESEGPQEGRRGRKKHRKTCP